MEQDFDAGSLVQWSDPQGDPAGLRHGLGVIVRTPTYASDCYSVFTEGGHTHRIETHHLRLADQTFAEVAPDQPQLFNFRPCVVLSAVAGSRAYGMDTSHSDTDIRGIYLAPTRAWNSIGGVPEQFEDHAHQFVFWEFGKFINLALKGNPSALEVLYSPLVIESGEMSRGLVEMRDAFLSRRFGEAYLGYSEAQFTRMQSHYQKHGSVPWKQAAHMLRILICGVESLQQSTLVMQVGPHRDYLQAVRQGERSMDEVIRQFHIWNQKFRDVFAGSKLPDEPDFQKINRFVIHWRLSGGP